jgi:ribosomal protein S18 acetylase RimI-like enzyme
MVTIRTARRDDLSAIVAMLADDALGLAREVVSDPVDRRYVEAFEAIDRDENQMLAVAISGDGQVIGCLQVSFLPGLSRLGLWRGQIESVRVAGQARGHGIGRKMMVWAIDLCAARGCKLVQLTSDKRREDALRFYASLGFEATHEGLKLSL